MCLYWSNQHSLPVLPPLQGINSFTAVKPWQCSHCCSYLPSHPKALHLPSEQMLSQIPHHWGLEPSFGPGQRGRTRMQPKALGSPELHEPPRLGQGAALPEGPRAALPRLGQLALLPSEDIYFCPGLLLLLLWDSSSRGQMSPERNKAPKFLFAHWAINDMEKWQEGPAGAAEQEQLIRADLASAVHPKTPTGSSLALARPAAVLSVQCIWSSPADQHWFVCIMQFCSTQL